MQNVKELSVKEMQQVNGGGASKTQKCIAGVAGGLITGGVGGGIKGFGVGGPWGAAAGGVIGGAGAGLAAAATFC
ncbi:Blp family class II bacteriocin [Enterococcus faecalis]|uniref:class IIb bacteriocin, lactobin A/cerein 7B family n=1 Tax=Enterococcus faecalis TaxID=1351 RepID=UPI001929724A|nr:Blp family class II bacteriocin [Enterococcus faecalis]EGO8523716.1 class IIb bacteriocin, lactobin A/cerein 7B family [Enterococcus faecalis]MCO5446213.1 Blp family class II bacteriocin [Enterococcus faecalis]